MKQPIVLVCVLLLILMPGCYRVERALPSATFAPTRRATSTLFPSPTASTTPTVTATATPTLPPEARLRHRCLEVAPTMPPDAGSSGIVVMGEPYEYKERRFDRLLLDMATGRTTPIAGPEGSLFDFTVSLDKKFIAFMAYQAFSNSLWGEDKTVQEKLVIANADGEWLKVIPWEKKWMGILGWTVDGRLLLAYDEPVLDASGEKQALVSYLVLDPFHDTQQLLSPEYPRLWRPHSFYIIPSWDRWYGVVYDPTLRYAVYPRIIDGNEEMYTYALWDVSKRRQIATLEDIFASYIYYHLYPMPVWSPDGSQFVFVGRVLEDIQDQYPKIEMYLVKRDGQVEQLTHLTPILSIQDSNFSWAPDGRHIAMFINSFVGSAYENKARVATLDLVSRDITDYCFTVTYKGEGYGLGALPPPPIWSPDGTQFLVVDWYEKEHQRVILVDIVHGYAAQIAQDMEPVGWMVSP